MIIGKGETWTFKRSGPDSKSYGTGTITGGATTDRRGRFEQQVTIAMCGYSDGATQVTFSQSVKASGQEEATGDVGESAGDVALVGTCVLMDSPTTHEEIWHPESADDVFRSYQIDPGAYSGKGVPGASVEVVVYDDRGGGVVEYWCIGGRQVTAANPLLASGDALTVTWNGKPNGSASAPVLKTGDYPQVVMVKWQAPKAAAGA